MLILVYVYLDFIKYFYNRNYLTNNQTISNIVQRCYYNMLIKPLLKYNDNRNLTHFLNSLIAV